MITFCRQYADMLWLTVRMYREQIWFLSMVNIAFALGLVLGFGYLVPDVTKGTATFLTTGAATQMIVTIGLVGLPQNLAQAKSEGRLEYFFTLPIHREAYLLAQISFVAVLSLPAVVFALVLGAWHYDFALSLSPWLLAAVPLSVLSLAGLGVAMAVVSPHAQLTNALTQLIIFYVLFFAPVLMPSEQLPWLLRQVATVLPPTYAADAMRATVSDLPGTHVYRSLALMAIFATCSLTLASITARRRG